MRHELDVFDIAGNRIGSLVIMADESSLSTLGPIFSWQWQGKGGSASGLWEWQISTDWRILLRRSADSLWGTLYGGWKSMRTPSNYPSFPWFSKRGVKSGDIRINTASNFYLGTWQLL